MKTRSMLRAIKAENTINRRLMFLFTEPRSPERRRRVERIAESRAFVARVAKACGWDPARIPALFDRGY